MNERYAALKVLENIDKGTFITEAIKDCFEQNTVDKNGRSFIQKIVFGVVEHRIYIDYVINHFSTINVAKMRPTIRLIMELSSYQLLFMKKVPESAVVNEAVKLVKKYRMHSLAGFVNAVLRKISTKRGEVVFPQDRYEKLRIKNSVPKELFEYVKRVFPAENFEDFIRSINEDTDVTIRTNHTLITPSRLKERLESQGIVVKKGSIFEDCFRISNYDKLETIREFKEGLFQVQDESSTIVGHIVGKLPVENVLDLCAAPGGKSTHIAQNTAMKVMSMDVSAKKVDRIKDNVKRLRLDNVSCEINDATVLREDLIGKFDFVLADVPCSGIGVIRKKPDIKYNFSISGVNELVKLQRSIIDNAVKYVKKEGYLLYSTCTLTKEENEKNVEYIKDKYSEFEIQTLDIKGLESSDDYLKIYPALGGIDGFFIALFKKK